MASTNKTPNFELNLWDGSDYVLRTDFNADNSKLDSALTALSRDSARALSSAAEAKYSIYNMELQRYYEGKKAGIKRAYAAEGFTDTEGLSSAESCSFEPLKCRMKAGGISQGDINEGYDTGTSRGTEYCTNITSSSDQPYTFVAKRDVVIGASCTLSAIESIFSPVFNGNGSETITFNARLTTKEMSARAEVEELLNVSKTESLISAGSIYFKNNIVSFTGFTPVRLLPGIYELTITVTVREADNGWKMYVKKTTSPINGGYVEGDEKFYYAKLTLQPDTYTNTAVLVTSDLKMNCDFDDMEVYVRAKDADVSVQMSVEGGAWKNLTLSGSEDIIAYGESMKELCFTGEELGIENGESMKLKFTFSPKSGNTNGYIYDYGVIAI